MAHSSSVSVNTSQMSEERQQQYQFVANIIREVGTPNPQFSQDKDIVYSELRVMCDGKLEGLGTILKNMKAQKFVDYRDPFIKDDTIVTLVEDYAQEAIPQGVVYHEIEHKVEGDDSGHLKVRGW